MARTLGADVDDYAGTLTKLPARMRQEGISREPLGGSGPPPPAYTIRPFPTYLLD